MENLSKEDVLQALNDFSRKSTLSTNAVAGESIIPRLLEDYLRFVASTGDTVFPWPTIKPLVRRKIDQVLCEFLLISSPDSVPPSPNVDPFKYSVMRDKIIEALDYFTQAAPFTIQRLCEVIVDPKRYYERIDKLMRAIEKNLLVTTTVDPRRCSGSNGEKIVSCGSTSVSVVNGFEGRSSPGSASVGHVSSLLDSATTGSGSASLGESLVVVPSATGGAACSGASESMAASQIGDVADHDEPMDTTGPPQSSGVGVECCLSPQAATSILSSHLEEEESTARNQPGDVQCDEVMDAIDEDPDGEDIDVDQPLSESIACPVTNGVSDTSVLTTCGSGTANSNLVSLSHQRSQDKPSGGSSQQNLLHIQQQMREQQTNVILSSSAASTSLTLRCGNTTVDVETGKNSKTVALKGVLTLSPTNTDSRNASSSSDGSVCFTKNHVKPILQIEGCSKDGVTLIADNCLQGNDTNQDHELEQQVPQLPCDSDNGSTKGNNSPVQLQSVSSQSSVGLLSQEAIADNGSGKNTALPTGSTSHNQGLESGVGRSLSMTESGGDQSSLVESSEKDTVRGDSEAMPANHEALLVDKGQQLNRCHPLREAIATASISEVTQSRTEADSGDPQERSIGQSSGCVEDDQSRPQQKLPVPQGSTTSAEAAAVALPTAKTQKLIGPEQDPIELDTTGSPPDNEAAARE